VLANTAGVSFTVAGGASAAAVGYLSGGGSTGGNTVLNANLTVGGANANAVYDGTITEVGGAREITKVGTGDQIFDGAVSYTGKTRIEGGALRTTPSAGAVLELAGGAYETSGAQTFSRNLGTGAGQLDWSAGGFSASGGTLTVQINGGTGALTWGTTGNFVGAGNAMVFGSSYSDAMVDFQNGIAMGGTQRTVTVNDNTSSSTDYTKFSGAITGTAGMLKNGSGLLALTGDISGFSGQVVIDGGGTLRTGLSSLGSSAISLKNGVWEMSAGGTMNRNLGVASGDIAWDSAGTGGGFSAYGGNAVVQLNGGTGSVTWASTANFVANGDSLRFGSSLADSQVDFQNGLALNNSSRTILVYDNPNSGSDVAKISGTISDEARAATSDNIVKTGAGTLWITDGTYNGRTTISDGAVRIAAAGLADSNIRFNSDPVSSGTYGVVEIEGGGTFTRYINDGAIYTGAIQWAADGGFAAHNGNATVTLDGDGAGVSNTIVWSSNAVGNTDCGFNGQYLVFGSATADSKVTLTNDLDMGASERYVYVVDNPNSGGDFATLSGSLTNTETADALTKRGNGTLELTGTQTFASGSDVVIEGGAVRTTVAAMSTDATVEFNGGVWEINAGGGSSDMTRSLGTGAGALTWLNESSGGTGGGFAAYDGTVNIRIGNGTAAQTWESTSNFLDLNQTLILGSVTATGTVDFQNGIDLGSEARAIQVVDNPHSGGDIAKLSGTLTSASTGDAFIKRGNGTLELTGAMTFASGSDLVIEAGAIRTTTGVMSANTAPELNGGVWEIDAGGGSVDMTRNLGSGAGEIFWTANGAGGGFSAYNGTSNIKINNGTASLTWGSTPNFVGTGQELILGSPTATGTVDFRNGIDLGSEVRTIRVTDNLFSATDVSKISGAISGTGGIIVTGNGNLLVSGDNTYTGSTTINTSTLTLGASDRFSNDSDLVINGGTLNLATFSERFDILSFATATIDFGSGGGRSI